MTQDRSIRTHEFFLFDVFLLGFEMAVYFLAFLGPALVVWEFRQAHPLLILITVLVGWLFAALVFILILIVARRLIIQAAPKGRMFRKDPKAIRWLLAGLLQGMLWRSPFWGLVNANFIYRHLFYRGMGAKLHGTFLTGLEVKITEPWSLKVGRNVFLAEGVVVAGHKIEREVVSLGPIEIGNDVLIGGRSIIFPDVKIGDGAVIGAGSVVTRGTIISPGETWIGNPAVRIDLFQTRSPTETSTPKATSNREWASVQQTPQEPLR